MKNRCATFISLVLVVSLLSISISCDPKTKSPKASPSSSSQRIPLVAPKNVGPPGLNLPGTTTDIKVSSQNGAKFEQNGVSIEVPPLALSQDGAISLKEFSQPPAPYTVKPGADPLPMAICISKIYDLGPEGTTFKKPVTVTLPYDKSMLEADVDTSKITLAYYNGENWVAVGGLVDPNQGTVTASMSGFPGEIFTIALVGGLAVTIISTFGYAGYKVYENYKADPISNNNAKDYVAPNSSTVADYTKRAGTLSKENGRYEWVTLEDPAQPGKLNPDFAKYAKKANASNYAINKITFDGSNKSSGIAPSYTHDFNWSKPDQYLNNGLKGDCTSITGAYLSMFRRLGIEAYGVDGDKSNPGEGKVRHTWIELKLDGEAYYYDDDEGIKPLKDVEPYLLRPAGLKGQGFMWNEKGQKRYEKNWWTKGITINSITPGKGPVGSKVTITGTGFGNDRGTSTITFNNTLASSISSWSDKEIKLKVPDKATTGNVIIKQGTVESNRMAFEVTDYLARLQSYKTMEGLILVKAVAANTYSDGPGDTEEGPLDYNWAFDAITWKDTSFTASKLAAYDGDTYVTLQGTVSPDGSQIISMAVLESPDKVPGREFFKLELINVPLEFLEGAAQAVASRTGPDVKNNFVDGNIKFFGHYDRNEVGDWKEQTIQSIKWTDTAVIPKLQISFR